MNGSADIFTSLIHTIISTKFSRNYEVHHSTWAKHLNDSRRNNKRNPTRHLAVLKYALPWLSLSTYTLLVYNANTICLSSTIVPLMLLCFVLKFKCPLHTLKYFALFLYYVALKLEGSHSKFTRNCCLC